MAQAHTRPRAQTATCTSSRSACSEIHSPSTQTNWSSVRSLSTTVCLQVRSLKHFLHILCLQFSDSQNKQVILVVFAVQKLTTGQVARKWWRRLKITTSGLAWSRSTHYLGLMDIPSAGLQMDTQHPKVHWVPFPPVLPTWQLCC